MSVKYPGGGNHTAIKAARQKGRHGGTRSDLSPASKPSNTVTAAQDTDMGASGTASRSGGSGGLKTKAQ